MCQCVFVHRSEKGKFIVVRLLFCTFLKHQKSYVYLNQLFTLKSMSILVFFLNVKLS